MPNQVYTVENGTDVVSSISPFETVTVADYYAGDRPATEFTTQGDAMTAATYVNSIQELTYVVVGPHPHPHK